MANANNPAAAEITFLVPSAPRFRLTVPGSVQELQVRAWGEGRPYRRRNSWAHTHPTQPNPPQSYPESESVFALLPAATSGEWDVAARLAKAYKEGIPDDSLCFMGVEEEFERMHRVEFKVAKLQGMPGVTFVWRCVFC